MSLTREEVEKVSLLARLLLTEDELSRMTEQLGAILEYMELLAEVDTTGVEPMAHAVELSNVFRSDTAQPSLDREAALANAPHRDAECYLVPAVLGEV
jgi:aspartyl-tRNA(Asn)/glutamyl-tRNA(Gln) amidotransferase subunit C